MPGLATDPLHTGPSPGSGGRAACCRVGPDRDGAAAVAPMLVDVRTGWIVAGVLLLGLVGGCSDGVPKIERSNLSRTAPDVSSFRLIDALPEPDDFGPGWTFDKNSVSDLDYYAEYAILDVALHCEGASPKDAGLTDPSKHAVSASLQPPQPPGYVWVRIAVDSPGASADRLALIRTAFSKCGDLKYSRDHQDYKQAYKMLRLPGVRADESFGVRISTEVTSDDKDAREVETWGFARSGGLVVVLSGREGVDVTPLVSKAMAEARRETGL
jgi:hypothetical protein